MTLADTNVWLALAISGHEHHLAARRWMDAVSTEASVLFCRSTQQSVLRLLTTSAVLRPYGIDALTNCEAWAAYEAFLADPRIAFAVEPGGLEPTWKALADRPLSSPKLWMDAYLAAFAIAGNHQLVTTDTAFHQFDELDLCVIKTAE